MKILSTSSAFNPGLVAIAAVLSLGACASKAPAPAATAGQTFLNGEILHTLQTVNSGEIKQGGQALQKSDNPHVLYLAQLIVQDHMAMNQRIAAIAQASGARLEQSILSRSMETKSKDALEAGARLSGRGFDCSFLQAQIDQHALTLKTIREQLLPNATAPEIKELMAASAPRIEHHMKMAQDYQTGLQCPRT